MLLPLVAGVLATACAHEGDGRVAVGVYTTTSAGLSNDSAAQRIAATRCRRAAECDRVGAGQRYKDQNDCLDTEKGAAVRVCSTGVDKTSLDRCLATLENEDCGADLGPVMAVIECRAYCTAGPELLTSRQAT
jgi:hypothetical protein